MFDQETADLSGLVEFMEPPKRLFVSQITHKAFIEVNEEGSEAAACSKSLKFIENI